VEGLLPTSSIISVCLAKCVKIRSHYWANKVMMIVSTVSSFGPSLDTSRVRIAEILRYE
jgi:ABC-type lipoprotein release transport system permease subunit